MLRSALVRTAQSPSRSSSSCCKGSSFHAVRKAFFSLDTSTPQALQSSPLLQMSSCPFRILHRYSSHPPRASSDYMVNETARSSRDSRRRPNNENPSRQHPGRRTHKHESWMRHIHHQIDFLCNKLPPGQFTTRHREQVEQILTNILHQYQKHQSPRRPHSNQEQNHPQQRSILLFRVLDRLCHEAEFLQQQHEQQFHSPIIPSYDERGFLHDSPTSFLQVSGVKLGTMLANIWREEYLAAFRRNHLSSSQPPILFPPLEVNDRIVRYIRAGLMELATPFPFSQVLHVIRVTEPPAQALSLSEPIFYETCRNELNRQYHRDFQPNLFVTAEMMEIWANSQLDAAVDKVEELLQFINQRFQEQPWDTMNLRPNPTLYTILMKAHSLEAKAKIGGSETSIQRAFTRIQELFHEMKEICDPKDINAITYNRTAHALVHCRHPQSPDATQAVVDELLVLYEQGREENSPPSSINTNDSGGFYSQDATLSDEEDDFERFKPSQHTFGTLITAYGRAMRFEEARAVFERMKQMYNVTKDTAYRPDESTYSSYLWACAKVGNFQHAEEVIGEMMNEIEEQDDDYLKLSSTSWKGMLAAWAESGDENSSENISLILDRLQKNASQRNIDFETDTMSYNIFMSSHARENSLKGAEAAEKLFRSMDQTEQPDELKPDRDTCLDLIRAWANAGEIDRAEERLLEFCDRINAGDMNPELIDQQHFNVIIDAWSNAGARGQADRAQSIFNKMQEFGITPDVIGYTCLMWTYVREPILPGMNARAHNQMVAERVLDLFHSMDEQYQMGDDRAKATAMTFNAIITALNKSFSPDAAEQAQGILDLMGSRQIEFDERMFNMVMACWGRQRQPEKVEEIYKHFTSDMWGFQPSSHLFVTRLSAWSRVGNAEKTSAILEEWIALYNEGVMDRRPQTIEFNLVVSAWCQEGEPERAEAGLRQMIAFAKSNRFDSFPDEITYTSVISAYARHRPRESIERVVGLFETQKELAQEYPGKCGPPDLLAYSGLIHCLCFESPMSPQTERQVFQLVRELKSKNDPAFWTKYRSQDVLKKIRRSLKACGLGDKDYSRVDHDFAILGTLARRNISRHRQSGSVDVS